MKNFAIPFLTAVVVVSAMLYQAATPAVTVAKAPDVRLPEIGGYAWTAVEPSSAEIEVLPKDTRIEKRRYTGDDGSWFLVSLVVGGKSKSSIHRPELCLPAQGLRMESPHTVEVGGVDWRTIRLVSKDSPPFGFAYTFFNQDGFRTASHVARILRDVFDRGVFNRIDRWVMLTVVSSRCDDDGLSVFLGRLAEGGR